MPAFILLVSIITSCCYASEQQQKTITIRYPGHTATITIPLDQQQKLKKSITVNTFRPYDKAVEQAFSSLFQSQRKRGLLTSIKGSLQQDSFWELVDSSGTASITISSEDSVLKIDRGKKPAWYRLLPNTIAQDVSETLDDVITDLGGGAIIPIAITDSIDLHSSAPLDFLIHAAKLMYDNKDKENLAGIIKSQAAYVKASVAQMQQALLWAQQLRLRQKYLDILVDIYADRLLHTDFTNIPQNIVMSGLPMTPDLDKVVAKNLVLKVLKTYFSSKDQHYTSLFNILPSNKEDNASIIKDITLKAVPEYEESPTLFVIFDAGCELFLRRHHSHIEFGHGREQKVLDVSVAQKTAKVALIRNNGQVELHDIIENPDKTFSINLKNSFLLTTSLPEVNAAIIYAPNEQVYVGFGSSLYLFDIVDEKLKLKQAASVYPNALCHIKSLSVLDDLLAITYELGEIYHHAYYKIGELMFLPKEKEPDNTIEVRLDIAEGAYRAPIAKTQMLLIQHDNHWISNKDIMQARGFHILHDCYDMFIKDKKIYLVLGADVKSKENQITNTIDRTFNIRTYDIVPPQLVTIINTLNQQAQIFNTGTNVKKDKNLLTVDVLSLIATSYSKVGPVKISSDIKKQISTSVRAMIPSNPLSRLYHYMRHTYFSVGGHTTNRIKNIALTATMLGGYVALNLLAEWLFPGYHERALEARRGF